MANRQAQLDRLAREGRAILKKVRGLARPLALTTRRPDHGQGLSPEWLAWYGHATRLSLVEHLTDAEALALVSRDRTLLRLPALLARIEKQLHDGANAGEPGALTAVRDFFEALGRAIHPRRRGQFTEWDGRVIDTLYRERHALNKRTRTAYRHSGQLPPAAALPVLTLNKTRLEIGDPTWPSLAAWEWVRVVLDAPSAATLQDARKRARRHPAES